MLGDSIIQADLKKKEYTKTLLDITSLGGCTEDQANDDYICGLNKNDTSLTNK